MIKREDKEKNVPELRFKGFSEAWEQRKLKNLASFSKGKGYTKKELTESGQPIILYGQVYTNYKTVIENVNTYVKEKENSIISEGNEIIVPASGETSEDISRASVVIKSGIILGGDLNIIKPKGDLNATFVALTISNGRQQKELTRRAQGKSVVHLRNSDLKNVTLLYPEISEQTKIGNFFTQLDDTIALHQEKLDRLHQLKKGYLQVMFPLKDEKVPKVRFADFKMKWEEHKLGELAEIVRGASPRPIKNTKWFDEDSDIGWLRISDVTEQNGRIYNLGQKLSEAGQEKTRVLTQPHLLLSIAATVGKPVINYVKTGVHDGFLIFKDPQFDIDFIFQWLEYFRLNWQKYGQPGSQVNLNSKIVKTQEITIPNSEEQEKIALFFHKIDSLVDLHKKKLCKLQKLKKVYLQKMFV